MCALPCSFFHSFFLSLLPNNRDISIAVVKRLRPEHNEEVDGSIQVSTVLLLLFVKMHHIIHAELLRKLGAVAGPCGGMEWWKVREEAHASGGAQA